MSQSACADIYPEFPAEGETLTFLDVGPQLVFTGALLEGFWELDGAGAQIPEENPEGVHVHGVIVLS